MKKSAYPDRYMIAMSAEDGCLVMLRNGDTVIGSVAREQSMKLAQDLLAWVQSAEVPPAIALASLNGHSV